MIMKFILNDKIAPFLIGGGFIQSFVDYSLSTLISLLTIVWLSLKIYNERKNIKKDE